MSGKTAEQIKDLIRDANGWEDLYKLIMQEAKKCLFLDMEFDFIESERENEMYIYTLSLDGQVFQCSCIYESWSDWGLETYNVKGMWPVKKVTKTVEVWEPIKDE